MTGLERFTLVKAYALTVGSWFLWVAFGGAFLAALADQIGWIWVGVAFLGAIITGEVADDQKKELERLYKERASR